MSIPVPKTFLSLPVELRWHILKEAFLSAALDDLAFRAQGGFHSFLIVDQRSGFADAPSVQLMADDLITSHPCFAEDIVNIQGYVARLFRWLGQCPLCESYAFCDPGSLFLDMASEENDDEMDMELFGL